MCSFFSLPPPTGISPLRGVVSLLLLRSFPLQVSQSEREPILSSSTPSLSFPLLVSLTRAVESRCTLTAQNTACSVLLVAFSSREQEKCGEGAEREREGKKEG